jgi:CO/xanthine dehydrogenase FAD-binding subunit
VSSFAYRRPENADALWEVLEQSDGEVALLAGGTDVVVGINKGTLRPATVVDLKRVDLLRSEIELGDESLRVGALAVLSDLIADLRVREHFAALVEAAAVVGSIQIRNRATLVGNVCNASPAADTAPALLVYGARVNLLARDGERSLPLADFFTGPGTTALRPSELVTSIDLPLPPRLHGAAFARVTRRRGFDLGTVSVACLLAPGRPACFGFGAVAARPLLAVDESGLLGTPGLSSDEEEHALERLLAVTSPISDIRASREYRRAMLLVTSRRALAVATRHLGEAG